MNNRPMLSLVQHWAVLVCLQAVIIGIMRSFFISYTLRSYAHERLTALRTVQSKANPITHVYFAYSPLAVVRRDCV